MMRGCVAVAQGPLEPSAQVRILAPQLIYVHLLRAESGTCLPIRYRR